MEGQAGERGCGGDLIVVADGQASVALGTGVANLVAEGDGYVRSAPISVNIPDATAQPPAPKTSTDLELGNGLGDWMGFGVVAFLALIYMVVRRRR